MSLSNLSTIEQLDPISDQHLALLADITRASSPQQLAWLSGYFWGISQTGYSNQIDSVSHDIAPTVTNSHLTIIFASQTGNAKKIAEQLRDEAKASAINVQLYDASDYKSKNLAKESYLVIVAATNGEGEAPENAQQLHEFIHSNKMPALPNLHYAVLSLGDSSYEFFCQTGKDFDAALAKQGAKPFIERVDCDVDYQVTATLWCTQVIEQFKAATTLNLNTETQVTSIQTASDEPQYSKDTPFSATLLTQQKITGRGSDKEVYHVEIDLEGSGITYRAGDALGVWYKNSETLVDAILNSVGLSGNEELDNGESLRMALVHRYEITATNIQQVILFAQLSKSKKLQKLIEDKEKLRHYVNYTQLIDLLNENKTSLTTQELISLLRPLTPRLYSIASSQSEVENEVHLTVGVVEYQHNEQPRFGGASHFLTHQLQTGEQLNVYVEPNSHFKLPQDDNAPIIMIGPGTGVAPFRAFLQQREAQHAKGKNWLFFGERTFAQDFLYQVEWYQYLKSGLLTKMDVAFSRDQVEKVYVQHRIIEQAEQIWQWLQQGAYLYVCGDASKMAKDVHQALLTVVSQQGSLTQTQAQQYLNELRNNKRYQKDVY